MAYERINWQNGEVGNTPLNANNLNRMDMTIEEHDQKIGDHDYEIENLKTGAQGITEELNKKMDRINPQGSGTLSITAVNADNITAQTVEADEIKVAKVGSKGGTAPVAFDNDIMVKGINAPIGGLATLAKASAEHAGQRAEDAYLLASRANREAASAINKANDNKVKIDLHTGLIGEGVGDKEPIPGYLDGYYIAPNGSVTQYNATATLIKIDFLDFLFRGDNIIFNHVDLLPTENCIPCAWYDISGNFISAADGLNIIAEFDEQTFKITKQYIDYCIIPVPAGASSCKLSGLANGRADIRIQTSLSEAIKDLQSKPEPSPLVLTNPSPLPSTDGKKILGIDAVGRSWQNISPNIANPSMIIKGWFSTSSLTIDGAYGTIAICRVKPNTNYTYSKILGDRTVIGLGNYNGDISEVGVGFTLDSAVASRTVNTGNHNVLVVYANSDWSQSVADVMMVSEGTVEIPYEPYTGQPTPTSPIPITDASGEVTAHTINLFDKSNSDYILDAYINTTSKVITSNANSKVVYIPCKPNTTYTVSKLVGSRFAVGCINKEPQLNYVADAISANASATSITFTTNADAKYLLAWVWYNDTVSADVMLASVQIEEGDTATSYVPYQSNSVTLPFDAKSVGSVANELIVNEDGSGKIVQRVVTATYDGTEANWKQTATDKTFYLQKSDSKLGDYDYPTTASALSNGLCTHFSAYKRDGIALNQFAFTTVGNVMFYHSAQTIDEWKAWLSQNPITVYAVLKTSIEIPLTPEQVASIRQLMTYKGTTVIESEMQIESVSYSGDVKAYVDGFHTYSTKPTICGYEEDGTPIYRVKIYTTTHNTANAAKVVEPTINTQSCNIKHMYGTFNMDGALMELNAYYNISTNRSVSLFVAPTGVALWSYSNDTLNKPCEIVVEYTLKDSAPAAASVMSLDETEE